MRIKTFTLKDLPLNIEELLDKRIDKSKDSNSCFNWLGSRTKRGYGRLCIRLNGHVKGFSVTRLMYVLYKGDIPEGIEVCHTCNNPPCCNISHLYLDTHLGNQKFMVEQGRSNKGVSRYNAKLTEEQVKIIKGSHLSGRNLAKLFGVSSVTIDQIKLKRAWKHIV